MTFRCKKKARQWIARRTIQLLEHGWTGIAFAMDMNGRRCDVASPDAVKWNVLGALSRAGHEFCSVHPHAVDSEIESVSAEMFLRRVISGTWVFAVFGLRSDRKTQARAIATLQRSWKEFLE